MDRNTAVLALLGGLLLIVYAVRLLLQKRNVVKNGETVSAKVTGYNGKHTLYRFMRGDKSMTAYSLQRTGKDPKRVGTVENVFFNPQTPQYVVIPGSKNVELNASFMCLFGVLAIAGGLITLF